MAMMKKCFFIVIAISVTIVTFGQDSNPSNYPPKNRNFIERTAGLNMKMIWVKGGEFKMGNSKYGPTRKVKLDSYYIGECEVTQTQWKIIMGTSIKYHMKKSDFVLDRGIGPNYPMFAISWEEAQEFCKRLSDLTGFNYCLPTEAQWEYAARGLGKSVNYNYKYSGSSRIKDVAWYIDNSDDRSGLSYESKYNEKLETQRFPHPVKKREQTHLDCTI